MRKLFLLSVILLVGCLEDPIQVDLPEIQVTSGGEKVDIYKRDKTYMFGDSLCKAEQNKNGVGVAVGYKDVILDCVAGRRLTHFPYMPVDAKFLFLSGGTNDNNQGEDLTFFEERVQHYTQHPDVNVVCILPNFMPIDKPDSAPYRQVMIDNCADYIDPVPDCGVQILHPDGIHYYQSDRDSLGLCMQDKLYQYGVLMP